MKNEMFRFSFVIVGVLIAVLVWIFLTRPDAPVDEQVIAPPPAEKAPEAPVIQHPVTEKPEDAQVAAPLIAPEEPLPTLKESDMPMADILAKLFAEENLGRFFVLEHFIERFVVMVDNLPRQQLPKTHRPIKQTPGKFLAMGERDQLTIAPANYRRYAPLVSMLSTLNTDQVVAVYKRLYPLFQQAYEGLGCPDAYFNDRLIEVVDHLLETPQVADPVFLTQPKALYLFADPELEALSAGRKILIRAGQENAIRLKSILRDYRKALASGT